MGNPEYKIEMRSESIRDLQQRKTGQWSMLSAAQMNRDPGGKLYAG